MFSTTRPYPFFEHESTCLQGGVYVCEGGWGVKFCPSGLPGFVKKPHSHTESSDTYGMTCLSEQRPQAPCGIDTDAHPRPTGLLGRTALCSQPLQTKVVAARPKRRPETPGLTGLQPVASPSEKGRSQKVVSGEAEEASVASGAGYLLIQTLAPPPTVGLSPSHCTVLSLSFLICKMEQQAVPHRLSRTGQ